MSNEHNINELLSAYFDGEVTADERARVEQFLEESVEARCELDQFGNLSESLKSLPGEPAPPELLPSVMRRAEREALLSIDGRPVSSSGGRKPWLAVVAGFVVTAASVVLMIQFLPGVTGDLSQPVATNDSSSPQVPTEEPDAVSFSDDLQVPITVALAEADSSESAKKANGFWRDKTARTNDREAAVVAAPAASDSPTERLAGPLKMKGLAVANSDAASADAVPERNAATLRRARRGDVVKYFDTSGTKVTTYLVTVVDVKLAMNKLQLLLTRNDIPPQRPRTDSNKKTAYRSLPTATEGKQSDKKQNTADESDEKSERLFAIYIETTPGRYAAAFKDLMNDELFAKLSPKPPVDEVQIQVADLGKPYRSLFFQQDIEAKSSNSPSGIAGSAAQSNGRSAAKTPAPRKSPAPIPATPPAPKDSQDVQKRAKSDRTKSSTVKKTESSTKPTEPGRAEKSDSDKRLADGNLFAAHRFGELRSFQLQVQLAPKDAKVERQRIARFDQLMSRKLTRKVAGPTKNQALGGVDKEVAAEVAPSAVRVLFVFLEAPRQTPQP